MSRDSRINRRVAVSRLLGGAGAIGLGSALGARIEDPELPGPDEVRPLEVVPPGPPGERRPPGAFGGLTRASSVALDPDGTRVAAATTSAGDVAAWDARDGRLISAFHCGLPSTHVLALAPGGRRVAVAGPGRSFLVQGGLGEGLVMEGAAAEVWDVEPARLVAADTPPDLLAILAFRGDADRLLMATRRGRGLWDLRGDGAEWGPFPEAMEAEDGWFFLLTAFDPAANRVAARVTQDQQTGARFLTLWEVDPGRAHLLGPQSHYLRVLSFSPDGRLVTFLGYVKSKKDYRLLALNFETGELLDPEGTQLQGLRGMGVVAVDPEGRRIAMSNNDSSLTKPDVLRAWDLASGRMMAEWSVPSRHVRALAFLPDGRLRGVSGGLGAPQRVGHPPEMLPLYAWEVELPPLP